MWPSSAGFCCTSKRSGNAEPKPAAPGCARNSRTEPAPVAAVGSGGMAAANAVTSGVTRENPSARLIEAGLSGAMSDAGSMWTRSPVGVLGSAAEYTLDGQGRKQRVGSIWSQVAVRGARTPGARSATSNTGRSVLPEQPMRTSATRDTGGVERRRRRIMGVHLCHKRQRRAYTRGSFFVNAIVDLGLLAPLAAAESALSGRPDRPR